jgi:hypothetical protein
MALDSKTLIPVLNKRSTVYTASLRNGEYFEWLPATESYEDTIELSFRDIQYLHTTSATFTRGYLYIDNDEARKRLGLEREEIKVNQISRAEIEKGLKGGIPLLKKMLETIKESENSALLREVVSIAKEIKVDNTTKLQLLAEASGIPMEVLIDME